MGMDAEIGGRDANERMGVLLHLPAGTIAGDSAALRAELVQALRARRPVAVEEMVAAVHRAGLAGLLDVGDLAIEQRLDAAVRITLSAWERNRALQAGELEELRTLGAAVARAGVPLWRLLTAVQSAAQAGWQYAVEHAVALLDSAQRPGIAGRLIADLSVDLFALVGRIEAQIAAGYGETRFAAEPRVLLPRA
jgi:hypothetical protein